VSSFCDYYKTSKALAFAKASIPKRNSYNPLGFSSLSLWLEQLAYTNGIGICEGTFLFL